MIPKKIVIISLLFCFGITGFAQKTDSIVEEPMLLFESNEMLHFELIFDFDALNADRGKKKVNHQAVLYLPETDDSLKLKIKARGGFRMNPENCTISPLRFNFLDGEVDGTVFRSVNKIKLFTQCQLLPDYEDYIEKEYLAYILYEAISEYSHKVRLAEIEMKDVYNQDSVITIRAFFLEPDKGLEQRVQGKFIDVHHIEEFMLSEFETNSLAVFEYMIGNSDWLLYNLHNVNLLSLKLHQPLPVPNDFDCSGFVNPPYAEPAPDTKLTKVTERFYRGAKMTQKEFEEVLHYFNSKKEQLFSIIMDSDFLTQQSKNEAVDYLQEFYVLLNDPEIQAQVFLKEEEQK